MSGGPTLPVGSSEVRGLSGLTGMLPWDESITGTVPDLGRLCYRRSVSDPDESNGNPATMVGGRLDRYGNIY